MPTGECVSVFCNHAKRMQKNRGICMHYLPSTASLQIVGPTADTTHKGTGHTNTHKTKQDMHPDLSVF